ncbi:MAG TPA: YtxH domain-containing protein [Longimicrobiaceae bacterium]|nr:YtxH domain-containing protein [Longimicrobiaceae bacterium]
MDEYDDLPAIVIERRGGGLGAFVWGALLGAGAALLLAPRSGAETQRELRGAARRLRYAAEGRVNEARERMAGAVDRTRGRVTDQLSAVRESVETRVEHARYAVETGRQAARQARDDLRRRVDEAKEQYREGLAVVRGGDGAAPAAELVVTESVTEDDAGDLAR